MANIIQIKRSSSTTSAPSLAQGELAYSEESATQTLYYGTIGGSTIVIGGKKFIDKIDHTAGTLTASSALIADSNSKMDVLKSGNITITGSSESLAFGAAGDILLPDNAAAALEIKESSNEYMTFTTTDSGEQVKIFKTFKLNSGAGVNAILDEDNMASDSNTSLATQQSIKAYVDTSVAAKDTLSELSDTTLSGVSGGHILIYDGSDSWDNKAMSGDATIASTGAITIAATAVQGSMLNTDVISAQTALTSGLAATDEMMLSDGGTLKRMDVSVLTDYYKDLAVTETNKTMTSVVLNGAISGTSIKDEDDMASNSASHLATQQSIKAYVDATASGLDVKDSCRIATTAALDACTYNNSNGTLTKNSNGGINDSSGLGQSVTLIATNRVLVKDQASAVQNGIYTITTVGSGGAAWVLTRATDADTATEITGGTFTFVEEGTNADNGYVFTHNGSPTLGTTNLTVSQFSGAGQITAGTGLTKSGNTINAGAGSGITVNANDIQIAANYTGQNTITTLGTIATGVWEGTTVAVDQGGTGLTSYTGGDLLYASGGTTIAKLAKGTAGKVLMMNSGATAPEWANVDGGTY